MRNLAVNTGIGSFTNGSLLSSFVASESNRWHYLFCFIFFQTYEKFLVLSPVSDLKKFLVDVSKTNLFIPSWHLNVSKEHSQTEKARSKRAIREIPHFLSNTNVHYGINKIHKCYAFVNNAPKLFWDKYYFCYIGAWLLDEAETGLSRPDSCRIIRMNASIILSSQRLASKQEVVSNNSV